jgi:hypothetical protein
LLPPLEAFQPEAFLFQKLNTILKRRTHPFGLLAGSLAVLVLLTALTGMWHYQYEIDHATKAPVPASSVGYIKTSDKVVSSQQAGT